MGTFSIKKKCRRMFQMRQRADETLQSIYERIYRYDREGKRRLFERLDVYSKQERKKEWQIDAGVLKEEKL